MYQLYVALRMLILVITRSPVSEDQEESQRIRERIIPTQEEETEEEEECNQIIHIYIFDLILQILLK